MIIPTYKPVIAAVSPMCGPAAITIIARILGLQVNAAQVAQTTKPNRADGIDSRTIVAYFIEHGIKATVFIGVVPHVVRDRVMDNQMALIRFTDSPGHWVAVLGVDDNGAMHLYDPLNGELVYKQDELAVAEVVFVGAGVCRKRNQSHQKIQPMVPSFCKDG